MSVVDITKLGTIAAREWARLVGDALGDICGHSLPFTADDVATPLTLSRLINDWPVSALDQPVRITSVLCQDIPSVSSNCSNLVLTLEQDGESTLPDSLFVKLPMESNTTRWFFSIINSWRLESHFFRHVAQHVPLRTPITYATHWQGTRFFLIQENLHEDTSVRLFTNPDMVAGPSLAQVHRCLDTFAKLHSHHYGLSASERETILPLEYHPFLSPSMALVSRTLTRLALKPCMKKRPGDIPETIASAYRSSVDHWDTLLEYWFSGPLSLLHGDSHLGNFFISGDEMGMLDWQAAHWGKGIRDVQYFLIDSLPAQVLAAHERDLVNYYIERREHYGTAIDSEKTWQDYRSFTFHTLMTIIVAIGFGALNDEQDALMTEILHRAVAATTRVDYAEWLTEFIAAQ
ncbi:MAG: hypothetical protein ACJAZ0_003081 [Halioglobus sp.]|jgi:hypothetical protein